MTTDLSRLTCQHVVERVTELLGDALEPAERVLLEQHLLVCPPCTAHVAQMRATVHILKDFGGGLGADPAEAPSALLLEAFRRRHKGRHS